MNIETILGSFLFLFLIFGWIIIRKLNAQIRLLTETVGTVRSISSIQYDIRLIFSECQDIQRKTIDEIDCLGFKLDDINSSVSELDQMKEYLFEIESYLTIYDKSQQERIETMLDKINSNVDCIYGEVQS